MLHIKSIAKYLLLLTLLFCLLLLIGWRVYSDRDLKLRRQNTLITLDELASIIDENAEKAPRRTMLVPGYANAYKILDSPAFKGVKDPLLMSAEITITATERGLHRQLRIDWLENDFDVTGFYLQVTGHSYDFDHIISWDPIDKKRYRSFYREAWIGINFGLSDDYKWNNNHNNSEMTLVQLPASAFDKDISLGLIVDGKKTIAIPLIIWYN